MNRLILHANVITPDTKYTKISVHRANEIATIVLNDHNKLNLIYNGLFSELSSALM